ncbi:MAG: tRNA threonylcarbamoyladenosine dehydratase [Bacteroidaceae bacterium]|nr:tRNA threonylcarbamoyladenosine dehydratase [Bacteroidaceae bacterium]
MAENWLQRGELLLGEEKQKTLHNAHLLVVGLGGVGSWAAEMLCRAGVGAFTLVDADVVDITNINRQMPALASTVGQPKCNVVAERLRAINPEVQLVVKQQFITPDNIGLLLNEQQFDFVVDAIDTLEPKCALIRTCWERGLKIISSMGAGAKCDLAAIRSSELWKTEHCTLAKNVRRILRDTRGKYKLPVVYSAEEPRRDAIRPNPAGGKPIIGSLGYFTATFGCYIAEYVIKQI